ncbi:MAG: thioredoxin [Propionibacteriaceae bacterium]|nr:thioredoxin [Propionibacteriaceae bacterium]
MSALKAVTDATFATEVLACEKPVVVDYWADWCVPCRQLTPILEELAQQYQGQIAFVSVDTNENTAVASNQDIRTLPTVQIFVKGEIVQVMIGSVTKMKLRKALESIV